MSETTGSQETTRRLPVNDGVWGTKTQAGADYHNTKDKLHKYAILSEQITNYKEQAAVYGTALLFFAWFWGSLLYSLIGVGGLLAMAHAFALISIYHELSEADKAREYLRTHTLAASSHSENTEMKQTIDPAQILKDL